MSSNEKSYELHHTDQYHNEKGGTNSSQWRPNNDMTAPPPYTPHAPTSTQYNQQPQPVVATAGNPPVHNNWQQVPLPPEHHHQPVIQNQPIPPMQKPLTNGLFPETDSEYEKYLIASLCLTVCGLVSSSFLLLACALPVGFCLYKGALDKGTNANSKKLYMQSALCGSIAIMIGGILCIFFYVILVFSVAVLNAAASTTTPTTT